MKKKDLWIYCSILRCLIMFLLECKTKNLNHFKLRFQRPFKVSSGFCLSCNVPDCSVEGGCEVNEGRLEVLIFFSRAKTQPGYQYLVLAPP